MQAAAGQPDPTSAGEDADGDAVTSSLKIGDIISLFALEAFGFLRADGFVTNDLTVNPLDVKDPVPQNFEASLFQIESKLSYFAQQLLQDFVSVNNLQSAQDFDLLQGDKAKTAILLRAEAEKEVKRNVEDSKFYASRPLLYGQAFQLRHVNTNKFLSVVFGGNLSDVHGSADVELSTGTTASYFRLQSHRNIKSGSEECYEREFVQVVPEMLTSIALTTTRGTIEIDKHTNCIKRTPHSVSCTKEGSVWLVSRYQKVAHVMASASEETTASAQAAVMEDVVVPLPLHTGQVVRLVHQESDVFLAADSNAKSAKDKNRSRSLLVTEPACGFGATGYAAHASEAPGTCYTLWMVENLDPTVVKPLRMGKPVRLRNLATGAYLLSHYFAPSAGAAVLTPRGSGANTRRSASRNTLNASFGLGFQDQGQQGGTHVAFCGRETHMLSSKRSIMSFHSSSTANEGVSSSVEDDDLVRSQSIVYLKFEHLPPRASRPAGAADVQGGSAAPSVSSSSLSHEVKRPQASAAQDARGAGGWLGGGLGRVFDFQSANDSGARGGHDLGAPRDVFGADVLPSPGGVGMGILKATGMMSGYLTEPAAPAAEQTSTGWLNIWQPENGVNNPKPVIGEQMQEWHAWVMHPADKTEVCDVQFVAAINDKVRHFIRKYAGTGAIDIMAGEELSNVCECLQRFLTYAPGQVILMQADFPTSQDQVTRRQGIIYDMGLVDQLFSICCNLEQFNLASPPGADANSSSQYGASAGSATSGRSRLSHDHVCKDPEEGHIRRLCANCFQVLTLLVRKNHILGMHLADKINSLVEPLDHLAKAYSKADEDISRSLAAYLQNLLLLVQEIYHDSPAALANIQVSHLRKILELFDKPVGKSGPLWHAALLRLLGMLCIYRARDASPQMATDEASAARSSLLQSAQMGGTTTSRRSGDYLGIPNNQRRVMELLAAPRLGDGKTGLLKFFPRTQISAHDVDVMFMAFWREGSDIPDWQPAEEALQVPHNLQLFNCLMVFLKNVALGRGPITDQNVKQITREDASNLMDYDRAVHLLLSDKCPSRTRAIMAAFIVNVFVDNVPQEDCCSVLRFQDWHQLNSPLANSRDRSPENTQRFAVLQAFLLMHLEGNDVQGQDFDVDCLLEESLKMVFFLVRFGFYSQTIKAAWDQADAALSDPSVSSAGKRCFAYLQQRITAMWTATAGLCEWETWAGESLLVALLIQPLWLLLDISNDIDVTSPEAAARLKVQFSKDKLLSVVDNSETEHKHVVLGCKKWACRILDLVANVRLNKRVKNALQVFESDLSKGKQLGEVTTEQRSATHKVKRAEFEQIFEELDMNVEKAAPTCLQLLVDPAMQGDTESSYAVLLLVLRLFGQRRELIRTLSDMQLIIEPQVMHVYRDTSERCQQMSTLNVRLAACEHKLLEAMQLYEKMEREEEVKALVNGLDGERQGLPQAHDASVSSPLSRSQASMTPGASSLDFMARAGTALGHLGPVIFLPSAAQPERRSLSGEMVLEPQVSVGTLMDGTGGIFDNLLGAPAHLFDKLNDYTNSKTFQTPRGTTSSLSMRPKSMQEHRQVMQMRRLHATAKAGDAAGAKDSSRFGTPKKRKGGGSNLMRDVEAEAETRLFNESCTVQTLAFDASVVSELTAVVVELERHLRMFLELASSQQAPVDKLQHMFRTLGTHGIVFECLTSVLSHESPRMPRDDNLNKLLYQSFSFLALYAARQPLNQEIVFSHLHHMIIPQLINPREVFSAAAEALIAVFQDNRVLSSRFDDSTCAAIFTCLKQSAQRQEWRWIYLRCLSIALCPKGIPIKRNQHRVLRHLEPQIGEGEDVIPLYQRSNGLATLRHLMVDKQRRIQTRLEALSLAERKAAKAAMTLKLRQEQGVMLPFTAHADYSAEEALCRVNFFEETLNILAKCAAGAAFEAEQACQRFVPMDYLVELIQGEWCTPKVKIAALRLMREAFFDVADRKGRERAWLHRGAWKVLEYLQAELKHVLDRVVAFYQRPLTEKEERDASTPADMESLPAPLEEALVIESMKFLTAFIGNCFSAKTLTGKNEERLLKTLWVLTRMVDDGGLTAEVKNEVIAVITEFRRHDIGGMTTNWLSPPSGSGEVPKRDARAGAAIQRQYLSTMLRAHEMDKLEQRNPEQDMDVSLARNPRLQLGAFMRDLDARLDTSSESRALCSSFESTPVAVHVIIKNLYTAKESNRQEYVTVLSHLWVSLSQRRPLLEVMETMQMESLVEAVAMLLGSGTDSNVKAALTLSISLLQYSHKNVQDIFLAEMRKPRSHAMLVQLQVRLEMGREEMRELKIIIMQLLSDLKPSTLTAKPSLLAVLEQGGVREGADLSDRSFSNLVIKFVQGLCGGLPLLMQRLLGGREQNVNLVQALGMNVCTVEGADSVNEVNVDAIAQYFRCLSLLVQGPCLLNQHTLVRRTPIVRVVNNIICSMPENPKLYYSPEWFHKKRLLQEAVATFALGLVEANSQDPSIVEKIIDELDLSYIVEYVGNCYRVLKYNDNPLARAQARDVGFQWFRVLRTLADSYNPEADTPSQRALAKVLNDPRDAFVYFRQGTGSIEVLQKTLQRPDGCMCRIYFRIPDLCQGVTDKMRKDILWQVDHSSDPARLASFVRHIDDLYVELKWAELVKSFRLMRVLDFFARAAYFWYPVNVGVLNFLILFWLTYIPPPAADPLRPFRVQLSPESPQVYLVHIEETPWALVHDIFAKIQVGMEAVMVVWYVVSISPNMVRRWLQAREARRIAAIPPRKRLVPSAAGSAGHAAGAVGAGTRSAALSGAHHPVVKAPGKSGQRPRPPPPPGQHHRPESAAAAAGLEEGWLDHGVGYAVLCLWAGLHDSMLLWRLSTAIVAFFVVYLADDRNQINILWFAVLIFEVVPRSQAITFVLRAVRLGGEALIHTTCMTLVFVYAFAVGGFIVFPNLFQLRKPEVVDGTTQMTWDNHRRVPCNSVWKCMIVILDQGLRKEDVGEAMDKIPWPMQSWDGECEECPLEEVGVTCPMQKTCLPGYENLYSWPQSKLWLRIAYTFFFFCVISALAIQVIFGIIIDSFKRLREEREMTQREIRSKCFICGIARNRFDAESTGFRHHCTHEHNVWQYLNFLIHIRQKPLEHFDGPETTVYRQLSMHDISFLPLNKAISLKPGTNARQEHEIKASAAFTQAERTLKRTWRPIMRKLDKCSRLFTGRLAGAKAAEDATNADADLSVVLEMAQRLEREKNYSLRV